MKTRKYAHKNKRIYTTKGPLGVPWDLRGPRAYRKATHGPLWALSLPQWVPRKLFKISKGPVQTSKGPFGCPWDAMDLKRAPRWAP